MPQLPFATASAFSTALLQAALTTSCTTKTEPTLLSTATPERGSGETEPSYRARPDSGYLGDTTVTGKPDSGAGFAAFSDLPPVPVLSINVQAPAATGDYPYGPDAPAPQPAALFARAYLSATGSADPEGQAVETFFSVQDPTGRYLPVEPSPTDELASFVPTRNGLVLITLQVTELNQLRQTSQKQMQLAVAPLPCAADGVSAPCSEEIAVPGGSFLMGSPDQQGPDNEHPQHTATVSPFAMDRYEVTVGRFRRFLLDYAPTNLTEGSGAHPLAADSGWRENWLFALPSTTDAFKFAISECGGTWTDEVAQNEARPISCVTWFEAFAFCAGIGRRLPTEAEWEYAASGGDEQRPYPWGDTEPTVERAVFGCLFDGDTTCTDADLPVAGSLPMGAGRFGHLDLAGSLWEWTLDGYAPYTTGPCQDCAVIAGDDGPRVFRGGDFRFADTDSLRVATRYAFAATFPDQTRGFRCARSAP